jgi:hypothetical protein
MIRLVGRDRELATLDEALHRVSCGEREVVVITGEPGIGKSRLIDELAARVTAHGGRAAWGRTTEVGLTPAFWPWMQILGALEEDNDRAPRLGTLDGRGDAGARLALFDAVVAFLGRRAERQPLALLVDDAHAADPSSLQLLEHVVPLLARRRILVALAARDGDAAPEVASALGRILRGARRIALGRLQRDEVARLVGDRADAARVFELSEGNPLFVEELLASAEAGGDLQLPQLSSVREVVRERVARLPAATRDVLRAAAVVGREFRGAVVAEILDGTDAAARLAPALRLGMVAVTTPDRYRFSHALIAEAIADELDPTERARCHLRAAQALERRAPDDSAAIAHHLLAAGSLAAEAAVAAAERAAHTAAAQLAFEDAASLLERALAALALAAPGDARRRVELACARAEALQHAGQHARAIALLDELEPALQGLGDGELFARCALARGVRWSFGTSDPLLIAALENALARLPDTPTPLRARVLARLAAAAQPAADPNVPVERAREAIAMARSFPARERLDITYTATAALVDYVPPDELDALHRDVLELARAVGDRLIAVHTQLRMCFTALERIDREGFERAAAAHAALVGSLGLPRWLWRVHMIDALRAHLEGDFTAAVALADRARQIASMLADENMLDLCTAHEAFAAWAQTGAIGDAARELATRMGAEREAIRAWIAADRGDLADARAQLAAMQHLPRDMGLAALAATATVAVGDLEGAARSYEHLAACTGRIVLGSMVGFCVVDLYDRVLLVLATALGRWDAVDAHARAALAVAGQLASPVWAARVRGDWADALARRGRGGDAERARALWTEVLAEAERMHMPGLAARARAAVSAVDPAVTAPSREPGAAAGEKTARRGAARVTIIRAGELWLVSGFGDEIHVRDSRGMQMLARLVCDAGRELHALELSGAGEAADGGDAGEVIDALARAQYRERLAELVAERDQAQAWGDAGRAARADAEIEALTAELSRAVGLGGKQRRVGAASERARSNVQRRILHAIQQIRAGSQRLGEHFAATVRTGTYCCYEP